MGILPTTGTKNCPVATVDSSAHLILQTVVECSQGDLPQGICMFSQQHILGGQRGGFTDYRLSLKEKNRGTLV